MHLHRLVAGFGWGFAALAPGVLLLGGLSVAEIGFLAGELNAVGPVLETAMIGLFVPVVLGRIAGQPVKTVGYIGLLLPTTGENGGGTRRRP